MQLHEAARAGDEAEARRLLAEGGDVNARDSLNRTPLHLAAWAGHAAMVELLCQNGAIVGLTASDEMSALHFAAQKGHVDAVRMLLAGGAKASVANRKGMTPLHFAAQGGHVSIARLLARRWPGALRAENTKGLTPAAIAKNDETKGLLEELLAKRATEPEGKSDGRAGEKRKSREQTASAPATAGEAAEKEAGDATEVGSSAPMTNLTIGPAPNARPSVAGHEENGSREIPAEAIAGGASSGPGKVEHGNVADGHDAAEEESIEEEVPEKKAKITLSFMAGDDELDE